MIREVPDAVKLLIATCESVADDLLDVMLCVRKGRSPGSCVRTYYKLRRELPHHRPQLEEFRRWLEEVICVHAEDDKGGCDRLPLALDTATELEDYCQTRMREVYESRRDEDAKHLSLAFAYA